MFRTWETSTQNVVFAVLENRNVFSAVVESQTAELKEIHLKEATAASARHDHMNAIISATAAETNHLQIQEHRQTRQDVAQQAAANLASLRVDIDKRTDEIKELIKATHQAKTRKERSKLREKTNATMLSLTAEGLIYDSLMVCMHCSILSNNKTFY